MKDNIANISRRNFVKGFALSGLVLAVGLPGISAAEEAKKYGRDGMPHGWVDNPLVFVSIAEDGTVTIVAHRSEMGQGVRTSLPMVVADEMEADWAQVKVVQEAAISLSKKWHLRFPSRESDEALPIFENDLLKITSRQTKSDFETNSILLSSYPSLESVMRWAG